MKSHSQTRSALSEWLFLPALLLLFSCGNDPASVLLDSLGSIVGTVRPDTVTAEVRVMQVEEKGRAETDASGSFQIDRLRPGIYTLEVTAPGFRKFTRHEVRVFERATTTVGKIQLDDTPALIAFSLPEEGDDYFPMNGLIQIVFSEAMDQASVEQALSISPEVMGSVAWTETTQSSRLAFRPTPRLQPETRYEVTLAKEARSLRGDSLELDYRFTFTTQPVIAINDFPQAGAIFVRPRSQISLSFNTYMDLESVENAFKTEPASTGGFQWPVFNRLTFRPADTFFAGTEYTVRLGTDALDFEGIALSAPLSFSFTTEPLRVENYSPYDGQTFLHTGISITVAFNAAMDQNSVESAFSISPAIAGDFQWSTASVLRFSPSPAFMPGTTYTVNLETSAMDLGGENLQRALRFSFTTAP